MRGPSKKRRAQIELDHAIRMIETHLGPVTAIGPTVSLRVLERTRGGEFMPFDYSRHQKSSEDFGDSRPIITGDDKKALIAAGTTIELQGVRTGVTTQYGTRAFCDVLVRGQEMTLPFGYAEKGFKRRDDLLDDLAQHLAATGETWPCKIVEWGPAYGLEPAED